MNLFYFIIITIGVTAIKAEVDCRKRPPHLKLDSCCELSNLISEEIEEKCAEQENLHPHHGHPAGPPDHQHGPPGVHGGPHKFGPHKHCFLSCAVNETGILVDGELQEEALSSYLDELFGDNEKIEFLSNKFKFCNEKHKDMESNRPKHGHGPHRCHNQENGMLMGCAHMEAFKDCPDSFWSNTDECNELRDHFNQCRPPSKDQEDEDKLGEEEAEEI